ncbi:DNA repair protein RecN [Macrococcoides canis]|uniref:DNA repair protein RecN n=1 Tax=Macrococcoides canis TaxID=1855823 RepID=A0A4R6C7D7_9STAP|nr:DNA repair protein RecN [Macrococcus canis]MEE1107718.1 DNA repair protein RecN [Macrococcus canis]TDM18360.1 DNA repair protein RecN [Macrococcus canis]TDM21595.1 DNA repair protein RecN [Macrococcus canis]TDM23534.1 DNA repair protein RecN [Macrococcus canis]TDM31735.1 DNA repair protein RecN [Macrococcus canis]
MLVSLSIQQFAIIESLEIELKNGLTVLSGETGAGKSIIIDAIGQLIGMRASQTMVRHGEQKAVVEGVFDIENNDKVIHLLEQKEIPLDDFMLVKREIYKSGKSLCRINNHLITLTELREVMQELLDIHGQHETQYLLKPKYHIMLLDEYSEQSYQKLYEEYRAYYFEYKEKQKELEQLQQKDEALLQRLDLIKYQYKELSDKNLVVNEKERLEEEINRLENFEKLNDALSKAITLLNDEGKLLELLFDFKEQLAEVSAIIPDKFEKTKEEAEGLYYILDDTKHLLHDELSNNEYDEQELNNLQARLNDIQFLERKYGKPLNDLIPFIEQLEAEINKIENIEESTTQLQQTIAQLYDKVMASGLQLSKARRRVAQSLRENILDEIHHLEMKSANFEMAFQKTEPTSEGIESLEFMISPNKGEPLKSLYKIASGGELSRIMLALKSIFAESKGKTAILFDEVDTGVSGKVAQKMAEKMHDISEHIQVICISHLPQVAAISDHHLYIEKIEQDNRTITQITELDGEMRIHEVARMISGVEVTPLTLDHAAELIAQNTK